MMNPPSRSMPRRVLAALLIGAASVAACSRHIASNLAGPATPEARNINAAADVQVVQGTRADSATASAAAQGGRTYFDFQTQTPATVRADSRRPVYPADLRSQGVTGSVLAQFVVDASGNVDLATFKVLRETHAAFTQAVREAVPGFRYTPAVVEGRPVRQLVQLPFVFDALSAGSNAQGTGAPNASSAPSPASAPRDGARMLPDSPGPKYPAALREQGVEGVVIAQFVVDTTGDVLPGSLRVLRSSHEEFTAAVREAMPTLRFQPARVEGRAVRQLLQQQFEFARNR